MQASKYSENLIISDPHRIDRLVQVVSPKYSDRVLEVACGPGHVIIGFAAAGVQEAIGVDITDASLKIAEALKEQRKLENLNFLQGDADRLPLEDSHFSIVICRLSIHHFANPLSAISEMRRVCQKGGIVAIEDMYASEIPSRAQYWNHFERLADLSNVRALPLSELCSLLGQCSFEIEKVVTYDVVQDVEKWLENTEATPDSAEKIRNLLQDDLEKDRSGTRPWRDGEGRLKFTQHNVILIARKI